MEAPHLGRLASAVMGYVLLFAESSNEQRPTVPALRSHLFGLLDGFSKHPSVQRFAPDEVEEARFALVAWADEVILTSDWPGRDEWLREPLQLSLFRTNRAGNEFFDHLARLRPDQNDAREVFFLCLVHGFAGIFAARDEDGARSELIRQQFELLRVAGHARDAATASPLTPPAYDVAIQLRESEGRGLWPTALAWSGLVAITWLALWGVLRWLAGGVPLPPGL